MKTLTKIKLIHWHSFIDETISLKGSALLSGENGAGKSTILDAVQFVMMASKNNFNKAAHEIGNRKLTGYVRYKTGREKKPYERTGNVTAHVALEFYDEEKEESFLAGAVVDSASEDSEKTIWYLMEQETIQDSLFFDENHQIYSIEGFRKEHKLEKYFKTQTEARNAFRHKFGRLEEKFFDLIPKSLAFKPIDDIKDFVYSYVLDKKEVNIEELRENIMTYQSFVVQLEDVKRKTEKLGQIIESYREAKKQENKKREQDYFLLRVSLEEAAGLLEERQIKLKENRNLLELLKKQEQALRSRREEAAEEYHNLLAECKSSQDFLALETVEKELNRTKEQYQKEEADRQKLLEAIGKSVSDIKKIAEEEKKELLNTYISLFSECASWDSMEEDSFLENYKKAGILLESVMECKQEIREESRKREYELLQRKKELEEKRALLSEKIKELEKRKLVYSPPVLKLKAAIEKEFKKADRDGEVKILCELLNVSRETWRNAVEGYLNKQKFYLLVDPENFDLAVSAYDKLHRKENFYGAGIINTSMLEKYKKAPEGSLAEVVESKNKYAKWFVNMLLGRVMRCEKAEQLKQHEIAVTKDCLRYQNYVISAISPKAYETPYIGAEAYKIQKKQAEEEKQAAEEELEKIEAEKEKGKEMQRLCEIKNETEIKYGMETFLKARQEKEKIERLCKEKEKLSKNSSFIEKQIKLQEMEKEQKRQEEDYEKILKKQGEAEKMLALFMEEREELEEEKKKKEKELDLYEESLGEEKKKFFTEYEKNYGKKENKKDFAAVRKKIFSKRAGIERAAQKEAANTVSKMQEYRIMNEFGAEASMENFSAFYQEYDKLKNSEILNYEERAEKAREASEQEFKEQFLAKLQENIKQAQKEFQKLNQSLAGISFGKEHYRFECMPAKKRKAFYDMIMSDFNVMSGVSIFSGAFHENHREVIEELFDRLMAGGENGAALVEEFTDYRSYLDYDIRMEDEEGNYSYYSKVCKEKSGGETQTPFYVTVAASFVQLYANGIGSDSIGLVLFDEAFNNMDDERIGGVLGFFKELPLQLLIAAPPEKIQYIMPYVDSTLLVMQGENQSYVEEFIVTS